MAQYVGSNSSKTYSNTSEIQSHLIKTHYTDNIAERLSTLSKLMKTPLELGEAPTLKTHSNSAETHFTALKD